MRTVWIVAALAGLAAWPALAQQQLIPPSRMYSTTPPAPLDKSYGLPKVFTTEPGAVPQKVQPKAPAPDPFAGLSTFARPDVGGTDTPDFFAKSDGDQGSDVPNFFAASPGTDGPKVAKEPGYSTMETPVFTTSEGTSTDDKIFDRPAGGDTSLDDPAAGGAATGGEGAR